MILRVFVVSLLFSTLVCLFLAGRHTEQTHVRRIASVLNPNDFSIGNRLGAGVGGLQMIRERNWLGFGFHSSEAIYNSFYHPIEIIDDFPGLSNSYFGIGITGGIFPLACLFGYIFLSFGIGRGFSQCGQSEMVNGSCASVLCSSEIIARSAGIVLLVGFAFDGGLFRVSTGLIFWVMLELGNREVAGVDFHERSRDVESGV